MRTLGNPSLGPSLILHLPAEISTAHHFLARCNSPGHIVNLTCVHRSPMQFCTGKKCCLCGPIFIFGRIEVHASSSNGGIFYSKPSAEISRGERGLRTSFELMACNSANCQFGQRRSIPSRADIPSGNSPYETPYQSPHDQSTLPLHCNTSAPIPSETAKEGTTHSLITAHSLCPSARDRLVSHPSPISTPRPGRRRLLATP
jgi:hypothetical protein